MKPLRSRSQPQCRKIAYARDRGVCAECHCDTEAIARRFEDLRRRMWPDEWVEERAKWLEDLGFPVNGKSLWEADHIVPFALGGTDDLSNLVTLCVRCHRKKTDGQTGMLAKTARLSKSLPLKPGVKKVNPK